MGALGGCCLEGRLETKSHRSPLLPASKGWVSCLCTPRWVQRFAKEWDRTIIFFSLRSRKDWLTAWIDNFQPYSSRDFCRRLFVAHHPKPGPEFLSIDDPHPWNPVMDSRPWDGWQAPRVHGVVCVANDRVRGKVTADQKTSEKLHSLTLCNSLFAQSIL